MYDGRKNRGWKSVIWIFLLIFIVLSPGLGIFIDVNFLFPPNPDVHGHGIPVFTILLPMLAIGIALLILFIMAVCAIWKSVFSKGKHYEYIKSFWKYSCEKEPVLTLHEINLNEGRQGVRCIQIYRGGHKECFMNKGIYDMVPTVEAINALGNYTAYLMTEQEFNDIWSS